LSKNKIRKWAEMEKYPNVIQPRFEDVFRKDHALKGKWKTDFFASNNPLILELGCGRGEYTIGMARKFPGANFLGIDIKGARMWNGAATAIRESITNVGFLRTRIELIESFFGTGEVDEIWITFPDPQLKKRRNKKRLTGPRFLNYYRSFLKKDGLIHLKTDSQELYEYTLDLIRANSLELVDKTPDLYSRKNLDDMLLIRTHYEQIFMDAGKAITYLSFRLNGEQAIVDIKDSGDE
jgi:tRNA (guanine-N7-)-methyltransferase